VTTLSGLPLRFAIDDACCIAVDPRNSSMKLARCWAVDELARASSRERGRRLPHENRARRHPDSEVGDREQQGGHSTEDVRALGVDRPGAGAWWSRSAQSRNINNLYGEPAVVSRTQGAPRRATQPAGVPSFDY
jgi:hypothetical protein